MVRRVDAFAHAERATLDVVDRRDHPAAAYCYSKKTHFVTLMHMGGTQVEHSTDAWMSARKLPPRPIGVKGKAHPCDLWPFKV
jgi:hypothetical protein